MSFIVLFILNTLIWGTTWLAIKYQIEVVSPIWSVVYRFGLASLLLLFFCILTRRKLGYSKAAHGIMALQGLFLFCLNYLLYYIGTSYLISGLVALIAACTIFFNIINSYLFFKMPVMIRVVIGASIGFLGLAVVFSNEIWKMYQEAISLRGISMGIICCVLGALMASFGNMTAIKLHRMQIPLLQGAAISMMYGTLYSTLIALLFQQPLQFSFSASYLISLFYLTIFGTIIAFGCYLTLLNNVGPAQAGYISIITPLVAILISTFVESFSWNYVTVIGVILIIGGNILILTKRNPSVKTSFQPK